MDKWHQMTPVSFLICSRIFALWKKCYPSSNLPIFFNLSAFLHHNQYKFFPTNSAFQLPLISFSGVLWQKVYFLIYRGNQAARACFLLTIWRLKSICVLCVKFSSCFTFPLEIPVASTVYKTTRCFSKNNGEKNLAALCGKSTELFNNQAWRYTQQQLCRKADNDIAWIIISCLSESTEVLFHRSASS